MNSEKQSSRDVGIDLLKTIAVFGVIAIHMSAAGFENPVASFAWLSSAFWGSLVRGSVPIFLMCSGALLLNPKKELTIKKLYSKNILRLVIAMLVWSMAYKVYHLAAEGTINGAGIIQSVKDVVLCRQEIHMYYLQIMIIVYMFLPVTRAFVKHASRKELLYALAVWFLLGIVYPTLRPFWPFNLLSGIPVQWLMNMTYASIGYGILGYYLSVYPLKKTVNLLLCAAGFLFVFGMTVYMSVKNGSLYSGFLEGMSVGTAFLAAGLFGLGYGRKEKTGPRSVKLCTGISKASFCIFLVHVFIIYIFRNFGLDVNCFPQLISIPVLSGIVLLISYGVYFILSKIPVVNRWLI